MKIKNLEKATSVEGFDSLPVGEQVKILHESATKDIDAAIEESGQSRVVWLATSKYASEMLYEWSELQAAIKAEHDVDLPDLINGVTVTVKEA